jgi:hypothetical protein
VLRVWGRKAKSADDYLKARDGDSTVVPFECDLCIFCKLTKMANPSPRNPEDTLLMSAIRRINLNAFWSRSTATIQGNRDNLKQGLALSALVGLKGPYVHDGPYPSFDHVGYEVAIQMVLMSRRKGKHSLTHLQFDTIRKLRTVFGNQMRAAPEASRVTLSLGDQKGRYTRFTHSKCASLWLYRFLEGCQRRMGQIWKPNQAFSTELLLELLEQVDGRIEDSPSPRDENRWVALHALMAISYALSLRGPEGFLLGLSGLRRFWAETHKEKGKEYVIVALRGKIKGEHSQREHLLPCAPITSSGIDIKASINRLIMLKESQGRVSGPAISDETGVIFSSRAMDDALHEVLEDLFATKRNLFPPTIESVDELRKRYQVFRSFRRSSDTRALERRVAETDIDIVNRWATVKKAKGRRPGFAMRNYYADITLLILPFVRYTWAM